MAEGTSEWSGLGEPNHMELMAACQLVEQAFNEKCWLVGSAAVSRIYRDVDVRVMMHDDKYEALFGDTHGKCTPFFTLINISVSKYLSETTGLPVDFQVQKRSEISDKDWDKVRWPLGIMELKELYPEWAKKRGT